MSERPEAVTSRLSGKEIVDGVGAIRATWTKYSTDDFNGGHHEIWATNLTSWIGERAGFLLRVIDQLNAEIHTLQNAVEDIANRCNCLAGCDFADDPSCIARRALASLVAKEQASG